MPEVSERAEVRAARKSTRTALDAAARGRLIAGKNDDDDPHRRQPHRLVQRRHAASSAARRRWRLPGRGQGSGFEGMELGNKFPREPEALKKALAPFGLGLRLRLVFGRTSDARRRCGDEGPAAASRPAEGHGLQRARLRRDLERHPWRPREAAVAAPGDEGRRLGRVRPPHHRGRRAHAAAKACALVYHHHMGTMVRVARPRSTPSCARPATRCICCSTPATRPGAAPIRRRSRAAIAAASATCTPRTCASAVMEQVAGRGLELPRCGRRRRLHRAGRRHGRLRLPCSRSCRAIAAGSWSRPSRIRRRRNPLTYAKMGYANLTRYPRSEAGLR